MIFVALMISKLLDFKDPKYFFIFIVIFHQIFNYATSFFFQVKFVEFNTKFKTLFTSLKDTSSDQKQPLFFIFKPKRVKYPITYIFLLLKIAVLLPFARFSGPKVLCVLIDAKT